MAGQSGKDRKQEGQDWLKNSRFGFVIGVITYFIRQVRVFFNNLIFGQDESPQFFGWRRDGKEAGDVEAPGKDADAAKEKGDGRDNSEKKEEEEKKGKETAKDGPGSKKESLSPEQEEAVIQALQKYSGLEGAGFQVKQDDLIITDHALGREFILRGAAADLTGCRYREFAEKLARAYFDMGRLPMERLMQENILAQAAAVSVVTALAVEPELPVADVYFSSLGEQKYADIEAASNGTVIEVKFNGEEVLKTGLEEFQEHAFDGMEGKISGVDMAEKEIRSGNDTVSFHTGEDGGMSVSLNGEPLNGGKPYLIELDEDSGMIATDLQNAGFRGDGMLSAEAVAFTAALSSNQKLCASYDKRGRYYNPATHSFRDGKKAFIQLSHSSNGVKVSGVFPDSSSKTGWKTETVDFIKASDSPQSVAENIGKLFHNVAACKRNAESPYPDKEIYGRDPAGRNILVNREHDIMEQEPHTQEFGGRIQCPDGTVFRDTSFHDVVQAMGSVFSTDSQPFALCTPAGAGKAIALCADGKEISTGTWQLLQEGQYQAAAKEYARALFALHPGIEVGDGQGANQVKLESAVKASLAVTSAQMAAAGIAGVPQAGCAEVSYLGDTGTIQVRTECTDGKLSAYVNGEKAYEGDGNTLSVGGQRLTETVREISRHGMEKLQEQNSREIRFQMEDHVEMELKNLEDGNVSIQITSGDRVIPIGEYDLGCEDVLDEIFDKLDESGVDSPGAALFAVYAANAESLTYPSEGNTFLDMAYEEGRGVVVYMNMPEYGTDGSVDYDSREVAVFGSITDVSPEKLEAIYQSCMEASSANREDPWTVAQEDMPSHVGPSEVRNLEFGLLPWQEKDLDLMEDMGSSELCQDAADITRALGLEDLEEEIGVIEEV